MLEMCVLNRMLKRMFVERLPNKINRIDAV